MQKPNVDHFYTINESVYNNFIPQISFLGKKTFKHPPKISRSICHIIKPNSHNGRCSVCLQGIL
ncbi:hypothetical protein Hanom_Chr14g01287581 [Helianthus anomalus]